MSIKECVERACTAKDLSLASEQKSQDHAAEAEGYANDALNSANSAASSANYKGIWSSSTAYLQGESVYRADAFYSANVGNTNKDPLLSPTEWQKVNSIEEAPKDGIPYSRKDGYWVPMEVAKNNIGIAGKLGFGVGAIDDINLPAGFTKLDGHDNPSSLNYGNVVDSNGSVMVYIPAFFFRWNVDNTIDISATSKTGYVLHRAFRDGGADKLGFFIDKYQCGNIGGVFVSQQGIDPCSTHADHNPIVNLTVAPANNNGGLYEAVAARGGGYNLTALYQYNALALLAFAHGKAAASVVDCAYVDVLPHIQKGCNNNALKDTNDNVYFASSGYSNCALTGSGDPFAKTTHNGQSCGVADINGNMWEMASGFIKLNDTDAVFKVLKETVTISDIINDSTAQASGGAYDPDLYDDLDLTGVISSDTTTTFGNDINPVFDMSTDVSSDTYKKTCNGIPLAAGKSAGGTTEFGNDYIREYWRNQMACLVGGGWYSNSTAGAFALTLNLYRAHSYYAVGGRASFFV